jgi:hypothetical protein
VRDHGVTTPGQLNQSNLLVTANRQSHVFS